MFILQGIYMDIKLKIGLRIKESRKNKKFTAVQLAEVTGFSAQRISNWERGTRTPRFKDAEILGSALGVSPTWLLFLDIDHKPMKDHPFQTIPIINASSKIEGYLPIPSSIQDNITHDDFAFIVHDKSMSPIYNAGDLVTFCKEKQNHCDLVLIHINATEENLFRKISSEDNTFICSPINPDWPQIRFESASMFQIIGWVKNGAKVF
ncbi:TPA: helix-turn-helix domain-containing protein, partial [Legionella pneumophila]|nr:helix-turn-helix domain-containing protein [Legionella pneumophila]